MMTPYPVLVRGPRGEAHLLYLVQRAERTCQVVDKEGLIDFELGDSSAGTIVHRRDVFTPESGVQSGDFPDWGGLEPV
jgi:hypothetical protein